MTKWLHPVGEQYVVTQTYDEHVQRARSNGWCSQPGNCPGGVYYYGGIDYAVPTGTPCKATRAGEVLKVLLGNSGYGNVVYIDHGGGYVSICAHLNSFTVKEKQQVEQGQLIGYTDNTGFSTGPHLHFEVRLNGRPVDPQPLLNGEDEEVPKPIVPEGSFKVRVLTTLNKRSKPFTGGARVGAARVGEEYQALAYKDTGGEIWVEIEPSVWIAAYYNGSLYCELIPVEEPSIDIEPVLARARAAVLVAKNAGLNCIAVGTGDLQDLVQYIEEMQE